LIRAFKIIWNHERGKWRRHYLLRPWKFYKVWRSQRPDTYHSVDVGPDEDLYPIEGYRYQSPDLPYDPHHKEKWLNG
jgi:hypothetical protein